MKNLRIMQTELLEFRERVDGWVGAALDSGTRSLAELLFATPGVYPTELLDSIGRLSRKGECDRDLAKLIISDSAIEGALRMKQRNFAGYGHLEHPVDYEWHFTGRSQAELYQVIGESNSVPQRETVLCLGCPSVYRLGKVRNHYNLDFRLWDKNAVPADQAAEAEELANVDIRHMTHLTPFADYAILDPPWYNEYYFIFLRVALQALKIGGKILFSFPAEGTRPSATKDLKEVVVWLNRCGANLIERRKGFLDYRSPLFEVNALKACGVRSFPLNWRRSDLVIVEKKRDEKLTCSPVPELDPRSWEEEKVGCVRIKFRNDDEKEEVEPFTRIGKSDILPSVSRRFAGRQFANVVTSGNRFFRAANPERVREIVRSVRSHRVSAGVRGSDLLTGQLLRLLDREAFEAEHYFQEFHELQNKAGGIEVADVACAQQAMEPDIGP